MAHNAEQTARNAEADTRNDPGMCLQQVRIWAGIPALEPDAATAWRNATGKRPGDRKPPRGAPVYWTGGSQGFGHIATALGNGNIRTTDGNGAGVVATRPLSWVENNWGMPYAGWASSINGVTIPGLEDDEMTEDDWKRLRKIVAEEVAQNNQPAAEQVWKRDITVTTPDGEDQAKDAAVVVRETWQKMAKHLASPSVGGMSKEVTGLLIVAVVVVAGFFLAVAMAWHGRV